MKNILDKSRLQAEHRRRSFGGRRLGRAWLTAWIVVAAALIGRSLWSTGSEPKRLASATPLSGASWTEPSRSAEDVPSASRYKFRAIEELRVGDRVVSDNPDVDSPVETAIDPNTWRRLRLYAEERWPDGTLDTIHVDTLQSPEWIEQWQAQVGAEVPPPVDLVEMGLPEDLVTKVVANEPCPPLSPLLPGDDPGRLVLTTVDHLNNDVWELAAEPVRGPPADAAPAAASQRETLRPTGLHKFYSETRRDWVATKDLHDNEVIRGRAEPLQIVARRSLPGVQRVYNLTVEGEHAYYVSQLGLLAHNTCRIERYGSALEASRSVDIQGLHVDPDWNGKFKNVGEFGTVDPSKLGRKNRTDFSHRIVIELKEGGIDFLRKNFGRPLGHEEAYKIPASMVEEFNRRFVRRVTAEPR
jgi:hypothetical protein